MNIILDEIEIVENVLTPEDFVRLRTLQVLQIYHYQIGEKLARLQRECSGGIRKT